AAERSATATAAAATTTAAAAAKPESAGSKRSAAAGPKPAIAKRRGQRQRPKRTTAKRSVPGEKRTAKETAATTRRESVSIARLRKTAGQSVFALALAWRTTGRTI